MKKNDKIYLDSFDKGFIKALSELQKHGHLRNEALLEKELKLHRGKLYQIKHGLIHVPKPARDHILQYLTSRYDVNPSIFIRNGEKVFKNDPPILNESASEYEINRVRATAGDVVYIQKLEDENKHLFEENLLLRKLVSSLEKQLEKYQKKNDK